MNLLIYGSGVYARLLRENISDAGHHFVGYVDDFNSGEHVLGNYAEVQKSYRPADYGLVMGVGYRYFAERWEIYQKVRHDGYTVPLIVHPTAYVASTALLANGSVIMARAIIDHRVLLGELSVVWPGVCISHDTKVGNNNFLSPAATICGSVQLGDSSFIGAGAVIADGVHVHDNTFVGAGEVVGKHSRQKRRVTK